MADDTSYSNGQIDLTQLPSIDDVDYHPLAEKYPLLSGIETMIGWLIVFLIVFAVQFGVEKLNLPQQILYWPPALGVLFTVISYFSAKRKGFALREKDVIYRQGLFWRKQTAISFKRIQHIDMASGPLERYFGMTSIKFYTAGGSMADLKISGLPQQQAQAMRTHIMQQIGLLNDE